MTGPKFAARSQVTCRPFITKARSPLNDPDVPANDLEKLVVPCFDHPTKSRRLPKD